MWRAAEARTDPTTPCRLPCAKTQLYSESHVPDMVAFFPGAPGGPGLSSFQCKLAVCWSWEVAGCRFPGGPRFQPLAPPGFSLSMSKARGSTEVKP